MRKKKQVARYTSLKAMHSDAGFRRIPNNTTAMHTFFLHNARGEMIRNLAHEAHEQFVAKFFLRSTDTVLEIGGGIGACSIQINKCLGLTSRHIVVEPQLQLVNICRANGEMNNCNFTVLYGALSKDKGIRVPPFNPSRRIDDPTSWIFAKADASQVGPIVFSISQLPLLPTALIADCEGSLPKFISDFPEVFTNLRLVYYEQDSAAKFYKPLEKQLLDKGFSLIVKSKKHRVYIKF